MNEVTLKTDLFDLVEKEGPSEILLDLVKKNLNDLINRFTIIFENDRVVLEGSLKSISLEDKFINFLIGTRRGTYEYNLAISEIKVFYKNERFYFDITQNNFTETKLIYPKQEFSIVILK